MLTNRFLEQINNLRLEEGDDKLSYMTEITVCKDFGEILKSEGFNFVFNPNKYNGYRVESDKYYAIPVYIADIDEMFNILYE